MSSLSTAPPLCPRARPLEASQDIAPRKGKERLALFVQIASFRAGRGCDLGGMKKEVAVAW